MKAAVLTDLGLISELTVIGSRVYSFEDFERLWLGWKMLKKKKRFDPSMLISDIYTLDEVEKGIISMREGRNIGKILIKCNSWDCKMHHPADSIHKENKK